MTSIPSPRSTRRARAIAVLDQVRKPGITRIAIETQPKPAGP